MMALAKLFDMPMTIPESFEEYLDLKSQSELIQIISEVRDFGIGVIEREYEEYLGQKGEEL